MNQYNNFMNIFKITEFYRNSELYLELFFFWRMKIDYFILNYLKICFFLYNVR